MKENNPNSVKWFSNSVENFDKTIKQIITNAILMKEQTFETQRFEISMSTEGCMNSTIKSSGKNFKNNENKTFAKHSVNEDFVIGI